MKKALFILLLLLGLVAWWAIRNTTPAPAVEVFSTTPSAYPADFQERLARITQVQLICSTTQPKEPEWQDAQQHPPVGHPAAQKGGTVRHPNAGPFPAHFLRFGGSIQFFQQNLLAATEIPLVARQPLTGKPTAGVAEAWAEKENTYYFRINPAARYNNGRPVRAADYLLALLLQAEQKCSEFDAISTTVAAVQCFGDRILSVECREKVDIVQLCTLLQAAEPGFYAEFGSEFRKTYAQRIPPATGPYRVSQVEKGRRIRLERIRNWWGESLPLCRNRFNPDTLEYHFLTSEAQVWEFFLKKKLDMLQTRNIAAWQERLADSPELPTLVYDAEYPLPPYGIALNARTLTDLNLRQGLLQAMDMDKAVELMMRGEGQRLTTFHSGYGKATPKGTPQYCFTPAAASECFAAAGYTETGSDGILRKPDGTRLSVRLLYSPNEKISALLANLIRSAAACGAEIVPEPVPWQVCQRRLQERSHELVFWAVPAPSQPTPALFFAPDAAPDFSPFSLNSPEMNAALQRGNLAEVDRLVYELAVWLPGWKENRVYLTHHPRLRIVPSPWCFDALDAHLFWVEDKP